jgi:hypothetical protein
MIDFSKKIGLQTLILIIIGIFPYLSWGKGIEKELLLAFGLSLVNIYVGYFIVLKSYHLNNASFYKNVYGGMLVRMVFVISATLYLINFGHVKMIPFFMSLVIFYLIHQWTEITSLLKILPSRKGENI